MSFQFYKLLHLFGLFLVFASFGAVILHAATGAEKGSNPLRALVASSHGLGLVLILVSGFGMLARLGIMADIPGWAWTKVGIWLVVGGLIAIPYRARGAAAILWMALPLIGLLAGWIALSKPF